MPSKENRRYWPTRWQIPLGIRTRVLQRVLLLCCHFTPYPVPEAHGSWPDCWHPFLRLPDHGSQKKFHCLTFGSA